MCVHICARVNTDAHTFTDLGDGPLDVVEAKADGCILPNVTLVQHIRASGRDLHHKHITLCTKVRERERERERKRERERDRQTDREKEQSCSATYQASQTAACE